MTESSAVMNAPVTRRSCAVKSVLHVRVITGCGGGPDKTILNSPRFLKSHDYQSACLFLRPPGDRGFESIRQRAQRWAAPLVEIDDRGPWSRSLVSSVVRACDELPVNIWHAHDYKTNLLGLLLRRRRPAIKLVTTVHGWVERTVRTLLYHQLDRFTLPKYDQVIAVSPDLHRRCLQFGVGPEKLTLVENAIDTEEFQRRQSTMAARKALGWPVGSGDLVVGAVGRLSKEKGFDLLIKAVERLAAGGLNIHLAIAGDGPERQALEGLIQRLCLSTRVRLVGFQKDLTPFYEALDVFVLSSRREGLPNVLLEAMSLEVPVVATAVAGVPRLIEDGVNGILVPTATIEELVLAMRRALTNQPLRTALAAGARSTIVIRYAFDKRMATIAALYDKLLCAAPGDQR